MKTFIIAEPGSTHDGQLDNMLRLIDAAAECGADVFKSQWTSNAQTMCDRRHAPEYLDSYLKLQYPLAWHEKLRAHAKTRGMQYACTAYILGDPTLLAPFVDYLKISSFEAADQRLLREALSSHSDVIVSDGMDTYHRSRCAGTRRLCWTMKEVRPPRWLHCVSSYPAPLDSLNLSLLRPPEEDEEHEYYHGFSDHSHDVRVGAWAVAAGAQILETHFRLDDCDPANKDYAVAFTPDEFAEYIRNVRDCEAAMGDGVREVQECEKPMLKYRVTA